MSLRTSLVLAVGAFLSAYIISRHWLYAMVVGIVTAVLIASVEYNKARQRR